MVSRLYALHTEEVLTSLEIYPDVVDTLFLDKRVDYDEAHQGVYLLMDVFYIKQVPNFDSSKVCVRRICPCQFRMVDHLDFLDTSKDYLGFDFSLYTVDLEKVKFVKEPAVSAIEYISMDVIKTIEL